jgi:hypothetical protein
VRHRTSEFGRIWHSVRPELVTAESRAWDPSPQPPTVKWCRSRQWSSRPSASCSRRLRPRRQSRPSASPGKRHEEQLRRLRGALITVEHAAAGLLGTIGGGPFAVAQLELKRARSLGVVLPSELEEILDRLVAADAASNARLPSTKEDAQRAWLVLSTQGPPRLMPRWYRNWAREVLCPPSEAQVVKRLAPWHDVSRPADTSHGVARPSVARRLSAREGGCADTRSATGDCTRLARASQSRIRTAHTSPLRPCVSRLPDLQKRSCRVARFGGQGVGRSPPPVAPRRQQPTQKLSGRGRGREHRRRSQGDCFGPTGGQSVARAGAADFREAACNTGRR